MLTAIELASLPVEIQANIQQCRENVAGLHAELVRNNLVIWTAGNISERVTGTDFFVIKPSGVPYDELTADKMVVCTLDGKKIADGTSKNLQPSSDTAAHAYVYRHMHRVGGVVHTHSTYATAYAAVSKPIKCYTTMQADEFGGEIPVGPLALIGDDSIGQGIVEALAESRSRAVLMAKHGPFTIGRNAIDAVKAAVMLEDVARTTAAAEHLGELKPLPSEMVDRLWERYQNVYGQKE